MKKIYAFIFALLGTNLVFGQVFTAAQDTVKFNGNLSATEINGRIYLSNMGADPISIRVIRTVDSLQDEWATSFCNKNTCYPNSTDSAQFTLAKGENSNYLLVHYYHEGKVGNGIVKLRVYNVNAPDNEIELTYIGTVTENTVGIAEKGNFKVEIFPNPVQKDLYIKCNTASIINYNIINVTGREIVKGFTNSNTSINIEHLPSGVYFIGIEDKGQVLVKKFIKN
jgi:hypothetical protein